jgi:hypothetical protein
MGDLCIPKLVGCEETYCPLDCLNGTQHECPTGIFDNGCPIAPECKSVTPNCPSHCPKYCVPTQIKCEAGQDADGCNLEDFCISGM